MMGFLGKVQNFLYNRCPCEMVFSLSGARGGGGSFWRQTEDGLKLTYGLLDLYDYKRLFGFKFSAKRILLPCLPPKSCLESRSGRTIAGFNTCPEPVESFCAAYVLGRFIHSCSANHPICSGGIQWRFRYYGSVLFSHSVPLSWRLVLLVTT